MADWLTFTTVYLWAGCWVISQIMAVEPFDISSHDGRMAYFGALLLWPLAILIAPFKKLTDEPGGQ